tara:strand:- start:2830 stop:3123 length:294 start_codon:yes stop_codon:yes gene_type:complete
MIKLTQINTTTVSITRNETDGPVVDKQYIFKDVWINPTYVTKVEEDAALNNENIKKPLIKGLDNRATFSRVYVSSNNHSSYFSVVGHPNIVVSKLGE